MHAEPSNDLAAFVVLANHLRAPRSEPHHVRCPICERPWSPSRPRRHPDAAETCANCGNATKWKT